MKNEDEELGRKVRVALTKVQMTVLTAFVAAIIGFLGYLGREAVAAFDMIKKNEETARAVKEEQDRRAGLIGEIIETQERISQNQIMLYCKMQEHHEGERCEPEFIQPEKG